MKGNWGRVLVVDLTKGTHEAVEIPEEHYRKYLGGAGLACKWLFDRRGWEIDPLSPDNPLMIMMGPLSGLSLPGSSRLEFCARSPLTGIWGEASMGGHYAPQLKATGYDGVIIYGASEKPVYLYVTDKSVEIRDASHLWGKDSYETEEGIKKELGDKRVQVVSIGQGGENLVRYAGIMNDRGSTAGRTGMGAVMGSKKLKAVAARGRKKPELADEEEYKRLRDVLREKLKFSMVAEGLKAFGSNVHLEYGMAIGDSPTRNWTKAYWPNGPKKLAGSVVAETRLTKNHSCFACPIGCKRITEVKSGPFAVEEGPGPEYEAAVALGCDLMVDDLDANIKANDLCDRYGIDVISTGSTIAWAIEAYEKGILTDKETGGLKLRWGDPKMVVELIEKIARREGIGDILADGSRIASQRFGGQEFAIHVKGLECPMHDPRALWGMALTYATSIRGACHCADANLYTEMGSFSHAEQGVKRTFPFRAKGKGAQTAASQVKSTLNGSLVMCDYVLVAANDKLAYIKDVVNAVTGFTLSVQDVIDMGHRIWYLKRSFGNLCGATREDDRLPQRIIEPHDDGPTASMTVALYPTMLSMGPLGMIRNEKVMKFLSNMSMKYLFPNIGTMFRILSFFPGFRGIDGSNLSERERRTVPFRQMLDEFYQVRDIDQQGRPSRARLESLGMQDVAEILHG